MEKNEELLLFFQYKIDEEDSFSKAGYFDDDFIVGKVAEWGQFIRTGELEYVKSELKKSGYIDVYYEVVCGSCNSINYVKEMTSNKGTLNRLLQKRITCEECGETLLPNAVKEKMALTNHKIGNIVEYWSKEHEELDYDQFSFKTKFLKFIKGIFKWQD